MLEPADVAEAVVDGLRDERFLILPHPEVLEFFRRKAADYDRWLARDAPPAGARDRRLAAHRPGMRPRRLG